LAARRQSTFGLFYIIYPCAGSLPQAGDNKEILRDCPASSGVEHEVDELTVNFEVATDVEIHIHRVCDRLMMQCYLVLGPKVTSNGRCIISARHEEKTLM
jgi:hypothetical protein